MQVVLVVNAHIRKDERNGPGWLGLSLARELSSRGMLGKLLCYSMDDAASLSAEKVVSTDSAIFRKAAGTIRVIARRVPQLPIRRLEERRFDRIARSLLTKTWGDTLLCTKPLNVCTIEKAHELGMRTVLMTSVLHPRFNQRQVSHEQHRLGFGGYSVYTDNVRVQRLARAIEVVDRIIAANRYYADNYAAYGAPREKFLIPSPERPHEGVSNERFSPPSSGVGRPGTFSVLHVAHMTLIKGVQYLIEAWEKVESRIDGELVLFGTMDSDVRRIVRRGACRKVRFTGGGNPLDQYRRASVFVSPSVSDAGPNTVLEAMACGTPAIVSTSCGISRFIDEGVNGHTYQCYDVDRLAALLVSCYENRAGRERMASSALETATGFQLADYSKECVSLLERDFSPV